MTVADYRIESASPMAGPLLPVSGSIEYLVSNVGMAAVMAAKTVTIPFGREIRVVHVPTGEICVQKVSCTRDRIQRRLVGQLRSIQRPQIDGPR